MLKTVFLAALLMAMPPSFSTRGNPAEVEVRLGLEQDSPYRAKNGPIPEKEGARILAFGLYDETTKTQGANLFGNYRVAEGFLIFVPSHPLSAGATYRATSSQGKSALWKVPAAKPQRPVHVVRVYPGAEVLPANLLKFTIVFSGPMRQSREIFDQIVLIGPDGKAVEDPWRRTELWSDSDTRLNLWFHPGRVKLGVNLREQLGPPLAPNGKYELRITQAMQDASGNPLSKMFVKQFRASEERRARIEVAQWKLEPPTGASREPLKLHFPCPMDPFLLARELSVVDAGGKKLPGTVEVPLGEQSWWFIPEKPWLQQEYQLQVGAEVADLSGNTISRPFEVDLEALAPVGKPQVLRFTPGVIRP